jgi:acyl-CoA thioesterase II
MELPAVLRMKPLGDGLYEGPAGPDGDVVEVERNVVFGGQVLAQMIMAADADRLESRSAKSVKSIHAVFARAGVYTEPLCYQVDRMHDGRALGSDTVTFLQHDAVMARGLLLWSADEPDLIRHTERVAMPDVPAPDLATMRSDLRVFPGAHALIVDNINTWVDDEPLRPPVQNVWVRAPWDLGEVANQAVLSWATDGFLIGTAMLPHAGLHEGQAHRTISTGVVSHTLNFHEPFAGDGWLLLANESIWAGRGRSYGRCTIWTEDGCLVATYTQDNLVRAFPDGKDHSAEAARIM